MRPIEEKIVDLFQNNPVQIVDISAGEAGEF
jgi:hypothetical protein